MTGAIGSIGIDSMYILGGAVVVAIQAATIVAMLAQRARRRESEARNNAILRAIPDVMFVQTRDGVFVDYSTRDPGVLLVPPEHFLGRNMRDVLPPDLAATFVAEVERLFAGQEPVVVEYEILLAGEPRHFEARLVRCESDKFLSIVRDITERKRTAEELNRAHAELLRASRLATLGEFAGAIAHELAQPLTAIAANSHACLRLLDRPSPDLAEVRHGLRDVLDSGRIAREVIFHTRHLFSHDDVDRTPLDLAEVINEVCVMVYATLAVKGVTLDLQLADGLPAIRGDRVQLRQVILNLVSNGIQAMEHGADTTPRRLTISTGVDETGSVRVSVADTGVGFANVDRDRLFSVSYTTKTDGMGWGLSISRSIIEAHGGRLWAEPNDGQGAVFAFSISIDVPADAEAQPTPTFEGAHRRSMQV